MPGIDRTAEWGNKLAELVVQDVVNPPPAENVVNARRTDIDGTGIAALVSKLKQDTKTYDGFALILKHNPDFGKFQWLQFITRQLVVGSSDVKTGGLVIKTNTTSYQLVNSAVEITDYEFEHGATPPNWDTCWKVDGAIPKPFFRDTYEYAISDEHKLTAILDSPGVMVGRTPTSLERPYYQDLPDDVVDMGEALGTGQGTSRAYFSDYLMKKMDDGRWRIYARFDFSLTWNVKHGEDTKKENFTLHFLKAAETTSLLNCHKKALEHKTVPGDHQKAPQEPWKTFLESIA